MAKRDDLLRAFGEILKQHRLERGLTQTQVADLLGIAQPTYWEYENGVTFPSAPLMLELVHEFGITFEEISALVCPDDDDEPNGAKVAA